MPRFDEFGNEIYDEAPSTHLSPYEQAVANGGQAAGDALLRASSEYYENYPNGHEDGRGVNWYEPDSYQWLITAPGAGPVAGNAPVPGEEGQESRPYFNGASGLSFNIGGAPRFAYKFDPFQVGDKFRPPSADEAMADPGYQFRADEGRRALEQSAAGEGVLRTGGTLKDILGWGQNFASQEYANVYDRRAGEYDRDVTNRFNAWRANTGLGFDVAKAEFAPQLLEWQTKAAASQRAAELAFMRELDLYDREWDAYVYGVDDAYRRDRDLLQMGG